MPLPRSPGRPLATPPQSAARIHHVCLVDGLHDEQLVDILKENYRCQLYSTVDGTCICDWETGKELPADERRDAAIVFVSNNFDSPALAQLAVNRPGRPVIGPVYVKSRNRRSDEICVPKAGRRIYCDLMCGVMAAVGLQEGKQRKQCLELIHCMGGHVRKEAVDTTNVLVTARACGADYRKMVSMGLHKNIVRVSWVEECWKWRDYNLFNCMDAELLAQHRLGIFEGLRMHFHCIQGDEYLDMKKHLLENKGSLSDLKTATHIIYSHDAKSRVPMEDCSRHCKHVNVQWFWTSINADHCMLEQNYAFDVAEKCLETPMHRTSSASSKCSDDPITGMSLSGKHSTDKSSNNSSREKLLNLATTPDSCSNEELEKFSRSSRVDKRLQVCRELLETEVNYINALKLLVDFKWALEEELENGNETLMPKNEIAMIFGKVEPIIEVHEGICQEIGRLIEKYPAGGKDVCEVYTAAVRDLERVYPPYINNYDFAKDCLNRFDEQNTKFHVFRKSKETNPDFKRNTVTELLVRPVQRLPSVILLIKEICKRSDKTQAAKAEQAVTVVDSVLRKANEVRQRNDQHIEHLALFNLIDGVPAHLVCSKRTFVSECEVISVSGTGRWEGAAEGRRIKMMLFNDVIIVCKIRGESRGLFRLTRQSSLSSFRKPYKFHHHIMVQSMRTVQIIDDNRNDSCVDPPRSTCNPQLFVYTIREDTDEAVWIVEPANPILMHNFNQLIHNRLFIDTGREFIIEESLPVSECGHLPTVSAVNKYLNSSRWQRSRTTSSASFASTISTASMQRLETSSLPPPRTSTLRRALSGASFLFRKTFSRPNLAKISEDQTEAGMNGSGSGIVTRRGILASGATTPSRDGIELLITPKSQQQERRRLKPDTFLSHLQRTFSRKSSVHPSPSISQPRSSPLFSSASFQLPETSEELEDDDEPSTSK